MRPAVAGVSGGDDGPGRLFLAEVVLELVVDAAFA